MTRVAWCAGLVVCSLALADPPKPVALKPLQPGVEYGTLTLVEKPEAGDGKLHVVRIDPSVATLDLGLASESGAMRTAAQWSAQQGSNVGKLVHGEHINQRSWKKSYQSVLAMDPTDASLPKAVMLDRDAPGFDDAVKPYRTVVQNLRLIKGPGENVWKPNNRKWSEAFVAMDSSGRLLFCFTRTPYEMADLMTRVLATGLGIVRAMHVEGGPEASLSIRGKDLRLDLSGSYETGFFPRDDNDRQWELPNVIGVRAPKE